VFPVRQRSQGKSMTTKVVFPAAGLGTRFLPVTKALPKELLPLVDTPLIQYGIEEAAQSGLTDVYIITGRGKGAIEDYFDSNIELEGVLSARHTLGLLETVRSISEKINIAYIRQREPRGLGHAVLCAKTHVRGETFGVVLADDVISADVPCMAQLLRVYEVVKAPVIALMRVPVHEVSSYGIIHGTQVEGLDDGRPVFRLNRLVEKPTPADAPSDLAVIGRYILTPAVMACLDGLDPGAGGEIQLTDALNAVAGIGPVYGVCFDGKRYDAGSRLGFIKATIEFALRRPDLRSGLREYLCELTRDIGITAGP
jgi:UTP--glucose-1-phosphate uridylyltransferase